uniref:S-acyltransferase n=1 Tax=Fagus sylvatica TaxID=28930 RepID=A0A2N9FFT3_FAGSY
MAQLHDQRKALEWWKLIGRCTVSCITVLLSQYALSLIPRFFSASPFLIQLTLSGLVLLVVVGLGGRGRRLLGVFGSAPAFVFFNILFIWAVYFAVLRPAVSCVMDIAFNGEVTMLIIGLCSILSSNPGFVTYGSSDDLVESSVAEVEAQNQDSVLGRRVRYCRICKAYIKGFDHHCPAFGNCIDAAKSQIIDRTRLETSLSGNLAISTMLFSIFQLLWQINWKKYPEFQDVQSQQGQSFNKMRFKNPYYKGILQNVKEFLGF